LLISLSAALPDILTAVVTALLDIIQCILDDLPTFMDAFLQLFSSCVEAIV
jgi:hypothetical protein